MAVADTFMAEVALHKFEVEEGSYVDEDEIKSLELQLKKLKGKNKVLWSENDILKSKLGRHIESKIKVRLRSPERARMDHAKQVAAEKEEYDVRIS